MHAVPNPFILVSVWSLFFLHSSLSLFIHSLFFKGFGEGGGGGGGVLLFFFCFGSVISSPSCPVCPQNATTSATPRTIVKCQPFIAVPVLPKKGDEQRWGTGRLISLKSKASPAMLQQQPSSLRFAARFSGIRTHEVRVCRLSRPVSRGRLILCQS